MPAHFVRYREEACEANGGDTRRPFSVVPATPATNMVSAASLPEVVVVVAGVLRVVVLRPIAGRSVLRPASLDHSAIIRVSFCTLSNSTILLEC